MEEGRESASPKIGSRSKARICPVVEEMLRGVFTTSMEGHCSSECHIYHQILYLEHCIERNIIPEGIGELLDDESSQVRRLCQIVMALHSISGRSMAKDPANEVRVAHISKTSSLDDIVESIDDESRSVRICLLRRLQPGNCDSENSLSATDKNRVAPISIPIHRQEEIFTRLSGYINDRDHTVRLELIQTLKAFSGLSDRFILNLFDKKNIGLFVYGAEDEMMEIRKVLILAIETFSREATSNAIFEYLIDMLNDESEEVRETVVTVLGRVASQFHLFASKDQFLFLLNGIEEDNEKIKHGILNVLSDLRYDSIEIYTSLSEQRNVENSAILRTIRKIVSQNIDLFRNKLEHIYSYSIFDENPFERGSSKRFYNLKYLAKLVVLRAVSKYCKIDIGGPMRHDFGFLRLKLFKGRREAPMGVIEDARMAAICFFERDCIWSEDYFGALNTDIVLVRYLIELCKALALLLSSGDRKELCRIIYVFGMKCPGGTVVQQDSLLQLAAVSDHLLKSDFRNYFNSLDLLHLYKHLVICEFVVNVPEVVELFNHTKSLARFVASLLYTYSNPAIKFIVEDSETGKTLEYPLSDRIHLVIDNCPEILSCYIATKHDGGVIKLSNVGIVRIINIGDTG